MQLFNHLNKFLLKKKRLFYGILYVKKLYFAVVIEILYTSVAWPAMLGRFIYPRIA
jgi:hypothetical protein